MEGLDFTLTGVLVGFYILLMCREMSVIHGGGDGLLESVRRYNRLVLHSREVVDTTVVRILVYGLLFGFAVGYFFKLYFLSGSIIVLAVLEFKLIKYKASMDLVDEWDPITGVRIPHPDR